MAVLEQLSRMSDERFAALYEALTERGYGPLDAEVAKELKFRPQAIRKVPLEKRAKRARTIIERTHNDELCYEFFGTYLVRTKKELVTGFLDETGVKHEEGMIEDIEASAPDPDKVEPALAKLDAAHGADDVTLYLALCVEQWPEAEHLRKAWEARGAAASA